MRCRLAVLTLFAVLPGMIALSAPAPAPYAILQIAPPRKGESAEKYRKGQIEGQTDHGTLAQVWSCPEVRKLSSFADMKDGRPWIAKNLRVTEENGGRCLRFTFRAGTSAEQVTILNAFLRANLLTHEETTKWGDECLRNYENNILDLERRIKSSKIPREIASYRKAIDDLRSIHIPKCRAAIAREKQFTFIRWAK